MRPSNVVTTKLPGTPPRDITSGPHDMYYSKNFSSSLSLITHSILIFRSESMEDSDVIDSLYYGLGYEDIV